MERLYTIAEMSKLLNIPESTVRFYRDRYSDYMPYVGEGRKKRYKAEAMEALKIIAEENKNNATAEAIAECLSAHFTRFVEIEEETAMTIAVEQQQDVKELLSKAISIMTDQKKQIELLNARVMELEKQNLSKNEELKLLSENTTAKLTAIQQQFNNAENTRVEKIIEIQTQLEQQLSIKDIELTKKDKKIEEMEKHLQDLDQKLLKVKEDMEKRKSKGLFQRLFKR